MEVRQEIVVAAPLEEVWAALSDSARLEEWFANEVELDLRPGGRGRFRWDDGETREAFVDEVDLGRRLAFRWSEPGGEDSRVVWELDETADGTQVTVVESLPTDGPRACAEWGVAIELWATTELAYV